MKLNNFAAVAALSALAACTGLNTAITEYSSVKPVQFAHDGSAYRVYDKPDHGKMMITPSIAGAAAYPWKEKPWMGQELVFADAAQAFVAPRQCQVADVKKLITPQFEVTYACR